MDYKKERILLAAEKLFAHYGIKKTTMDEIAKKARMGKSTLYYYFKSKEEIFAEVIRKDSFTFKNRLTEAISKVNTPKEKIRAYFIARMMHLSELKNFYTTLTDEYLEQYFFVEKVRNDFTLFENELLKKILLEGIDQGIFQINNIDTTVRMMTLALKGIEYSHLMDESVTNIENDCKIMPEILFKGIERK